MPDNRPVYMEGDPRMRMYPDQPHWDGYPPYNDDYEDEEEWYEEEYDENDDVPIGRIAASTPQPPRQPRKPGRRRDTE